MTYKFLKTAAFLSVISVSFLACNSFAQKNNSKNTEITSVSITDTFGRGGTVMIRATKDSLISENRSIASKEIPNFKGKIDPKNWDLIVSSIDLNTVKVTKSGASRGYYDGPDEIFEISTKDEKYSLINVQDSLERKQLKTLKVLLRKLAADKK